MVPVAPLTRFSSGRKSSPRLRSFLWLWLFSVICCRAQSTEDVTGNATRERVYPVLVPFQHETAAFSGENKHSGNYRALNFEAVVAADSPATSKGEGTPGTADRFRCLNLSELPEEWIGKEKFLLVINPKYPLIVEVNQVALRIQPGISTRINITRLLRPSENAIIIRPGDKSEKLPAAHEIAATIAVFVTPLIHLNDFYTFSTVQADRPQWNDFTTFFWLTIKNYSAQTYDLNQYQYLLRVVDLQGRTVKEYKRPIIRNIRSNVLPGHEQKVHMGFVGHTMPRWTAETPSRYRILISSLTPAGAVEESFSEITGFRTVKLEQGQLFINHTGTQLNTVMLDSIADTATSKQLESLCKTFKQHNVNTLWLPAYQIPSALYDLCARYGLYIIQNLPLPLSTVIPEPSPAQKSTAAREPVHALVNRLKNHPSIICWLAEGYNPADSAHANALNGIRETDPERPLLLSTNELLAFTPTAASHLLSGDAPRERALLKKRFQYVDFAIGSHLENTLQIVNKYNFTPLDKMTLRWRVQAGEKVLGSGTVENIAAQPGQTISLTLPFSFTAYAPVDKVSFRFQMHLTEAVVWAPVGHMVAWEEFVFSRDKAGELYLTKKVAGPEKQSENR
jgi:hypothetical protein